MNETQAQGQAAGQSKKAGTEESKAIAKTDREHQAPRGDGQSPQRKTNREKKAELHEVLTAQIDRDKRIGRITSGKATEEDIEQEKAAIAEEARAASRQLLQTR